VGEQFAVLMFFDNGKRRYVSRFVSAQEANRTFESYTHCVDARDGRTVRVVVTDRRDCILREWKFRIGCHVSIEVNFPPMGIGGD
jgi:hypothetical protein